MPINRRSFLTGSLFPLSVGAGALLRSVGANATVPRFSTAIPANTGKDVSYILQRLINRAASQGYPLALPPGRVIAGDLQFPSGLQIVGMPGKTILEWNGKGEFIAILDASDVQISGIGFDGKHYPRGPKGVGSHTGLIQAVGAKRLRIEHCRMSDSPANGITLEKCSGSLMHNEISNVKRAGIFARDSTGLEVSHNTVRDCANNGILIWRSTQGEDGTIVSNNRVFKIASQDGGEGQNGNGINVFRAGNVIVSSNRISDCAFSAVRVNSGNAAHIMGNSCARLGEVAIFVEFGYLGAVVSNNSVEHAEVGISITNMNVGGRLAVCQGNLIRELFYQSKRSAAKSGGIGIFAEADVVISGNTIERAPHSGLLLGWGPFMQNINATGNIILDCGVGISATTVDKAGKAIIANNLIANSKQAAIRGMAWHKPTTGDLLKKSAKQPANLILHGNTAT